MNISRIAFLALASVGLLAAAAAADELAMADGRKLVGKVLSETNSNYHFQVIYPNGGTAEMDIAKSDVQAVKLGPLPDKPKPVAPAAPAPPAAPPAGVEPPKVEDTKPGEEEDPDAHLLGATAKPDSTHVGPGRPTSRPDKTASRTAAEIDALIDKAAKEPPDWWNSVKLSYPQTMDLTWGRPVGPWDPNKNINQYLISVLNPNPSRHKEGCKFLQFVYSQNKGNTQVQFQAAQMLGQYYGLLLGDWARGAFWYRKAATLGTLGAMHQANLARCYFKLGSKELAIAVLEKAGWFPQVIRQLGEMGDTERAIQLAGAIRPPEYGSLLAGDVCRYNGIWKDALASYTQSAGSGSRNARIVNIARASADAIPSFERFDLTRIANGTYLAESGGGFIGPIKVQVAVKDGRITEVKVVASRENWPLNALVVVPAQIIAKQSVVGIDTATGATFTSDAVLNAAAKALASGVK